MTMNNVKGFFNTKLPDGRGVQVVYERHRDYPETKDSPAEPAYVELLQVRRPTEGSGWVDLMPYLSEKTLTGLIMEIEDQLASRRSYFDHQRRLHDLPR